MVSFDLKSFKYWWNNNISFKLLVVVLILNIASFIIYLIFFANKNLPVESIIFNYITSTQYTLLIVNFVTPLVLSIIAYTVQLHEKRIDEKKDTIYDSIKRTQDMWRDLLLLTSEVRYYHKEKPIEQLHLELDAFRVTMREVKNTWDFNFKNLEKLQPGNTDYMHLLKKPMYVLYSSADTVVQLIHDNHQLMYKDSYGLSIKEKDKKNELEKERKKYQYALGIIQTNINNIYHDAILNILKNYLYMEYGDKGDGEHAKEEIKKRLNCLNWYYNKLLRIEVENNKVFSYLDDYKSIQCCFNSVEKWIRSENSKSDSKLTTNSDCKSKCKLNNEITLEDCHMFKKLKEMHRKLPENRRIYSISSPYCSNCMMEIANYLDFIDIRRDLTKRAGWEDEYKKWEGEPEKHPPNESLWDIINKF